MALLPESRFQQIRRLTEITRALAASTTADEVLDLTIQETCGLVGTQNVAVAMSGPDGGISIRASPALRLRAQTKLREGFSALDERAIERLQGLLSTEDAPAFVAVPLVVANEVAGVLAVARADDPERSADDEEWLLSAIADQAALSLEKLVLNRAAGTAEQLRRQREEQFRSLYESPLIGLVFRSRDGIVLSANDAFLALSAYSREDVAAGALRWESLVTRLDEREPTPVEAGAQPMRPFESQLARKDGQKVDVLLGTAKLVEQERDLVFVFDVSALKRAESYLRILSETSKALLGASLDYEALFKSIAWLVVPRFADWCAVEAVEEGASIGRHVALENVSSAEVDRALEWRRRFRPDPRSTAGVAEVIRTGRSQLHPEIPPSFLAEYTCESNQSSELCRMGPRSALLVPMLLHGRVAGVLTFVRASTRRPFDRDALALAEEIARRASSAVENARLYHRAQEAVGLRDEFLAIAAHELKTPLATLQLQLDVVRTSLEGACADDDKLARRLELATRQVDRLTQLVSDLVNVSRLSAGQMALNREVCDLAELVRDVTSRFSDQAQAFGSTIRMDLPRGPVRGIWDRLRIEQVITNLLSNALKYGAGKPVRISLTADSMARLSVRDEGIGIRPQDAARIFDRFERAVSTQNYGGLGMGLFIARQIVEAHGGDIRVISRPGEGAEFIVQLPKMIAVEEQLSEDKTR